VEQETKIGLILGFVLRWVYPIKLSCFWVCAWVS